MAQHWISADLNLNVQTVPAIGLSVGQIPPRRWASPRSFMALRPRTATVWITGSLRGWRQIS